MKRDSVPTHDSVQPPGSEGQHLLLGSVAMSVTPKTPIAPKPATAVGRATLPPSAICETISAACAGAPERTKFDARSTEAEKLLCCALDFSCELRIWRRLHLLHRTLDAKGLGCKACPTRPDCMIPETMKLYIATIENSFQAALNLAGDGKTTGRLQSLQTTVLGYLGTLSCDRCTLQTCHVAM